jgi:L-alanine-DL-glutamate epimerase-like enolase superfamily enzyme
LKIHSVDAVWLHVPLPAEKQHRSDFGRISAFDGVLVSVRTEDGAIGYGEAKPAVGSSGNGAALVAIVKQEFAPLLIGADAAEIGALGQRMLNGSRAALALRAGRAMPILGRRGVHQSAIAGVDLALWDLLGKAHGCSVLELIGGACRPSIPAYASGGWASAELLGDELGRYVEQGFRAIKMRFGAMDGGVRASLARVRAARAALGPGIALMVDAHGTLNVAEARRFCAAAADLDLRFVEEPVCSDDRAGLAEVRRAAAVPIAAGESESSCFDFAELLERRAIDVLQPDLAIAGGFSEGLRIAALAWSQRLELAPHCWGSALSFQAARTLALASPAGTFVEVPMGGAPLLRELAQIDLTLSDGALLPPAGPGWGVEPDPAFVKRYTRS